MASIGELLVALDELAPFNTAEEYDNAGLLVGDKNTYIKGVVIVLDVTEKAVATAIEKQANVIISHHPFIFNPIKRLTADDYYFSVLEKCIKNDICLIAVHTNFDRCKVSNSSCLCNVLGANKIEYDYEECACIGSFDTPVEFSDLAERINGTSLKFPPFFIKNCDAPVTTVYAIGGSGGSSAEAIKKAAAVGQCIVTSEYKHSNLMLAEALKLDVIALSHYDSEIFFIYIVKEYLSKCSLCATMPLYMLK